MANQNIDKMIFINVIIVNLYILYNVSTSIFIIFIVLFHFLKKNSLKNHLKMED